MLFHYHPNFTSPSNPCCTYLFVQCNNITVISMQCTSLQSLLYVSKFSLNLWQFHFTASVKILFYLSFPKWCWTFIRRARRKTESSVWQRHEQWYHLKMMSVKSRLSVCALNYVNGSLVPNEPNIILEKKFTVWILSALSYFRWVISEYESVVCYLHLHKVRVMRVHPVILYLCQTSHE